MIYLVVSILFMVLLAVVFRVAVDRGADALGLNAAFRCTSGVAALIAGLAMFPPERWPALWNEAGWLGLVAAGVFWLCGYASIKAVQLGIPTPCLSSALAYFDGYRSERLPANLLQAQRDYFGAHTYERVDQPRGQFFHTNWTGRGGKTTSQTYTV